MRRGSRTRLGTAALLAMVGLLAMPGVGQAQLTWSPDIGIISTAEMDADSPRLATDGAGNAIVVWRAFDGERWRVEASFRPAGGTFGVPPTLLQHVRLAGELFQPRIAMDPAGNAVAVWFYRIPAPPNTRRYNIYYSYRPAGGSFGAPQFLEAANLRAPDVAMDRFGNALVVWRDDPDPEDGIDNRARAAFKPAGASTFGAPATISAADESVEVTPFDLADDHPDNRQQVIFDGQGNALAVWTAQDFGDGSGTIKVRAAFRPAGGSFGPPVSLSSPLVSIFEPHAAFDAAGNAMVAWTSLEFNGSQVQAAIRPAGGTFGPPQPLSVVEQVADQSPRVEFDPGGAVVAWSRNSRVTAVHRPPGGPFGPLTPVSDVTATTDKIRTASDSAGNALALWRAQLTNPGGEPFEVVQAAYRRAGAGAGFDPPQDISIPPGEIPRWEFGNVPEVALTPAGEALAAWTQVDAISSNSLVHVRIGTPPGIAPPPPPPPPPQPDKPNVIQPAEQFKRSRAVVVTANVAGAIDRLEWDLPGGHPPVVGTVVDGQLQKSVRFRPASGQRFSVKVRAVGPGGSASFARSFTAPRALTAAEDTQARHRIEAADVPRVFAVGHANALLGKASASAAAKGCGPMSVISGDQKLTGCFSPAEALGDIPDAERGVIDALARELKLQGAQAEVMRAAVEQTDGYIARGQATINDQWPVIPGARGAVAAFPQAKALASSDGGLKVGGQIIKQQGGFLLKFDPRKEGIDLGPIPRPPSLPTIGGFRLVGDFDVDLERREARITAHLKLPSFLKKAGIDIQSEVKIRATVDEIIVDEATIGPINVNIGALDVDEFRIAYRRAEDTWQGQGKACVIKGICLDMIPPNGQIKIKGGRLDFAGASLGFPLPGIPLFSGVNLERIGFGFGLDPTRFTGNARLTFAHLLVVDGRIVIAFPTQQTPFFLRRDEVGNDFPAKLYSYRYTGTTVGLSAAAALRLPVVGEVPLANAYVLYEYPGYLALGGGVNYAFREPLTGVALVSVDGRVDGEFNAVNGRFNVDGNVNACVVEIICKGAGGNVSNNGMSVCTTVDAFIHELHMGGAIRWSPFKFIPYLDGCKWGRFREPNVRGARAAQAGGAYQVQIARDQPSRMVMLEGVDGAPGVRVTGPGGQVLESPAGSEIATTQDAKLRIMRSESAKFVAVGFADAAPGTYSIEQVAGSAAVGKIQESSALPNARASGKVSGKGKRRLLSYRIGRRPDQTVSFFELGPGGGGKLIGSTSRAGKGKLRFRPAPGRGTRRIEARFELDGVPAEQKVIARFRPPSPKLGKPRALRARRKGKRLLVSWRRVKGATRYELALTTSIGKQRYVTTRKRRAVLKRVPKFVGGRVSVRAVDQLREGAPKIKRFKRAARRRLNFRPLPRCKVKRKVVCRQRR